MTNEKEQLKCEVCQNILKEKGSFHSTEETDVNGHYQEVKIYQCPVCKNIEIYYDQ